jgi:hypothetical protein
VSSVVVAFKIGRSRLAAEIAIDALVVDVKFAIRVLAVFVCWVCHLDQLLKFKIWGSLTRKQSFFKRERHILKSMRNLQIFSCASRRELAL